MSHTDFRLAGGSVIGRNHRNVNVHHNGQDGFHIWQTPRSTVAVVTDGCGSGQYSEIGALLGARLIGNSVMRELETTNAAHISWRRVQQNTLSTIDLLSTQMGCSLRANIEEYFLFTALGVVLADERAEFFALGDGLVIVNNDLIKLGPFANNQPPYIGYNLLGGGHFQLEVIKSMPLTLLDRFLIGTDGANDLIEVQDHNMPGLSEPVGEISQFWNERYFDPAKPDMLNRRLRLISRDWPKKNPQPGLLPDDTTIISGRRFID